MKKIYLFSAVLYSMSAFAQVSTSSAKPVTILDFKAVKEKEAINLKWTVTDETYIDEYRVQRSSNGVQFYTINTVKAKATPAALNFVFNDNAAEKSLNYYRIGVVERGNVFYSKVVSIRNVIDKNSFTVATQGQNLSLRLNGIDAGTYRLSVMNTSGQLLQSLAFQHDGSDLSKLIDMKGSITRGVYRVTLQGENAQFIKSILVQ